MDELVQVEEKKAYQILYEAAKLGLGIQIKILGDEKILNTELKKIGVKKNFYITSKAAVLESKSEVTLKIIFKNKLFFLKTNIKKSEDKYYFENCKNLFELVRRKNPRFQIPDHWPQSAIIQSADNTFGLRSSASIVEISKSGMRLIIGPELPRYEKNQIIKLKLKIFRRGEIVLSAKIVHLKKNASGGPTIGVQFTEDTILLKNKIQNICDDLAFYYVTEEET